MPPYKCVARTADKAPRVQLGSDYRGPLELALKTRGKDSATNLQSSTEIWDKYQILEWISATGLSRLKRNSPWVPGQARSCGRAPGSVALENRTGSGSPEALPPFR